VIVPAFVEDTDNPAPFLRPSEARINLKAANLSCIASDGNEGGGTSSSAARTFALS